MSWFSMRRVRQELEAKLSAPNGSVRGKIECKWYAGGGDRLKLKLSAAGLPDGADVTVRIAGTDVAAGVASGGDVRLDQDGPLPELKAGDAVAIVNGASVIASGRLIRD